MRHATPAHRHFAFILTVVALLAGCAQTRRLTIVTRPQGAMVKLDGADLGPAPVAAELTFDRRVESHTITATKPGHREQSVQVTAEFNRDTLAIDLKPESRRFSFTVTPLPATISIDGKVVTPEPAPFYTAELEFTLDPKGDWTTHTITAQRPGYAPFERVVTFQDPDTNITLALDSQRKDISIASTPPGADATLDGKPLGKTPLTESRHPFPVDPSTGAFLPQKLTLEKPGFNPLQTTLSWDDGKEAYTFNLPIKSKTIHITVTPTGATVLVGGETLKADARGIATVTLDYSPVNDQGDLPIHTLTLTKKTADSEWTPVDLKIPWDDGKTDYSADLKEIVTRPVPLVAIEPTRTDDGWDMIAVASTTLAMKDVTEGPDKPSPQQLTQLPKGTQIDSITVSPDGRRILFVRLLDTGKSPRSQLVTLAADGSGGTTLLTDGKSLDLTPSFTPDGTAIVFASNRAGKRPGVWQMDANGAPGVTQLTGGDTTDLWPSIDADPKPRLFYEALVDTRPDPRLYMTQLGTTIRTDLIQSGGQQPRISPKGDSIVFAAVNEKTGKRDIFRMSDKGGLLENLTNTPDADESDPVWNKDATKIAFVSDSGLTGDGKPNKDIRVIDLKSPERPVQVTANGSWDDSPAWDPSGDSLYFRSNRGGSWQIWRVGLR